MSCGGLKMKMTLKKEWKNEGHRQGSENLHVKMGNYRSAKNNNTENTK